MQLRDYQKNAVDAAIRYFRKSRKPACLVLPTGAGKRLVIAELARQAKGRVLVLAHVRELCQQNHDKFVTLRASQLSTEPAQEEDRIELDQSFGIYSAGLERRDIDKKLIFASIQSISRHLQEFSKPISLILIDECHRLSDDQNSQYQTTLAHFKSLNPELKVLGLTATPYRLESGWAYRKHHKGFYRTDELRPFEECVYEVNLRTLVDAGYLSEPILEDAPLAQYDFSKLGREYSTTEVNQLLVRHKRVTQSICEQVIARRMREGRKGVMLFAATVDHAREICSYLPNGQVGLILGETNGDERERIISAFMRQELTYLVNVAVLTTGFDATHVDFIALLRPTDSVALFQQMIGRGLRLHPGKENCLIIDYAGNGYDLYSPEIGEKKPNSESSIVSVPCPVCEFNNQFWGIADEEGRVIEHYGRRCQAETDEKIRCSYRFRFKECKACGVENDIAARKCHSCQHAIVDPDEELKNALRLKDGLVLRVTEMKFEQEKEKLVIVYMDEEGQSLKERFDFSNLKQLTLFNQQFSRRLAQGRRPLELTAVEQAIALKPHLPTPDFVMARKQKIAQSRKTYFRIEARIFDYQGNYRLCNALI